MIFRKFDNNKNVKYKKYLYKSEVNFEFFEFYYEGKKGVIEKVVEFQPTSKKNVFNLAFGHFKKEAKGIDDKAVTNNGDSIKVLATVASKVYAFVENYPDCWIIATGITKARTRLHRMGITNNLAEISEDFHFLDILILKNW